MRFLALLFVLFILSMAQGQTLGEAGAGQIDIPDSWVSYEGVWLNPEQTLFVHFQPLGRKGDLAQFSESVRARLVEQGGDKLLTATQMRDLGKSRVAYWRSKSKNNLLSLNYLISKDGNMVSLLLTFVRTPTEVEVQSWEIGRASCRERV